MLGKQSHLDHGQPTHCGNFVKSMYLHMSHISSFSNNYASKLKLKDIALYSRSWRVVLMCTSSLGKLSGSHVWFLPFPRIVFHFLKINKILGYNKCHWITRKKKVIGLLKIQNMIFSSSQGQRSAKSFKLHTPSVLISSCLSLAIVSSMSLW